MCISQVLGTAKLNNYWGTVLLHALTYLLDRLPLQQLPSHCHLSTMQFKCLLKVQSAVAPTYASAQHAGLQLLRSVPLSWRLECVVCKCTLAASVLYCAFCAYLKHRHV